MGISLIFCGIAARYAADTTLSASSRLSWGSVVTAGTFVYTATFGATWLTIPWLFPGTSITYLGRLERCSSQSSLILSQSKRSRFT